MSKYIVIRKLTKIANTLDKNGFIREANMLDDMAKKFNEYRNNIEPTIKVNDATYQKDVNRYRSLLFAASNEKDPTKKQQYLKQATEQYNGVVNNVWNAYSEYQKQSFAAQAERIRQEFNVGKYQNQSGPDTAALAPYVRRFETFVNSVKNNPKLSKDQKLKQAENEFDKIRNEINTNSKLNTQQANYDYIDRTYSVLMSSLNGHIKGDKWSGEFMTWENLPR
ncbi:MAG: hypothetical protein RLZ10_2626 [Bacteroidota bacterium]|jgi:hypothetical protein